MVGNSRKGKGPAAAKKGKLNTKVPKPRPHSSKRPKNYRRFDELTKNLRESLITTCAKTYFKHVDANGGSCARGFVDNLLASVREKAALLDITKDDLVNKFRQIKKQQKDEQEKNETQVSPSTSSESEDAVATEANIFSAIPRELLKLDDETAATNAAILHNLALAHIGERSRFNLSACKCTMRCVGG